MSKNLKFIGTFVIMALVALAGPRHLQASEGSKLVLLVGTVGNMDSKNVTLKMSNGRMTRISRKYFKGRSELRPGMKTSLYLPLQDVIHGAVKRKSPKAKAKA